MRARLLSDKESKCLPVETFADGTELLVQRLITQVIKQHVETPASNDADASFANDVMLDMQMDGVRCLLVRLPPEGARVHVVLSPREQEIVRMVAEGYPNKTIAAVLDISSWTVCTHLRRVFAKLNVSSRAQMVARLLEDDLLGRQFKYPLADAACRK
ncbi:MAG TPA: helix-turn-helix transcriptional regulator [Pyrinomonadaceae bacterium]|jgi:DNA-binding CsgD family transcriptional regulator